ncbi:unnamed protein product, partial [Prorocentrum cordatum]
EFCPPPNIRTHCALSAKKDKGTDDLTLCRLPCRRHGRGGRARARLRGIAVAAPPPQGAVLPPPCPRGAPARAGPTAKGNATKVGGGRREEGRESSRRKE